jgi:heme/copper-type cytochrome/quinol oxidase subunit 2
MRPYSVLLFLLATALCIVGQVALIRSLIAGRVRGVTETRGSRLAEITWIVLPAVVLLLLLLATWRLVGSAGIASTASVLAG